MKHGDEVAYFNTTQDKSSDTFDISTGGIEKYNEFSLTKGEVIELIAELSAWLLAQSERD